MKKIARKKYVADRTEERYEEYKKNTYDVKVKVQKAKKKLGKSVAKTTDDSKSNIQLFYRQVNSI